MDLTNICLHICLNEHNFLLKNHINFSSRSCATTFHFALLFCIAINFLAFVQSTSTSIWNIKARSNLTSCQTFQARNFEISKRTYFFPPAKLFKLEPKFWKLCSSFTSCCIAALTIWILLWFPQTSQEVGICCWRTVGHLKNLKIRKVKVRTKSSSLAKGRTRWQTVFLDKHHHICAHLTSALSCSRPSLHLTRAWLHQLLKWLALRVPSAWDAV